MKEREKFTIVFFAFFGCFLMLSIAIIQPVTAIKIESSGKLGTCEDFESAVLNIVKDEKVFSLAEKLTENEELKDIQKKVTSDKTESELENIANELLNKAQEQTEFQHLINYIGNNYGEEIGKLKNYLNEHPDIDLVSFLFNLSAFILGFGFAHFLTSLIDFMLPGLWMFTAIHFLLGIFWTISGFIVYIFALWLDSQDNPIIIERPSGQTRISIGKTYEYSTLVVHPLDKDMKYGWDWDGDENVDEWTDWYKSGEKVTVNHKFSSKYNGQIRVRILDESGGLSLWSEPLKVSMPRSGLLFEKIQLLLERWDFPILTKIASF
jgi:hypothetical protein